MDIANLEPGRRREWIDKLLGGDSIDGEPEFFDLLEADLVKIDNFYRGNLSTLKVVLGMVC